MLTNVQEQMILISYTMIQKLEKKSTKGPIYRSISLMNMDAKLLDVIKILLNLQYIKRIIHLEQANLSLESQLM